MKNVQYYSAFFHAKGEIKIAVSIEDEASKDLPPAALLYRPVRQYVYGVLFSLAESRKKTERLAFRKNRLPPECMYCKIHCLFSSVPRNLLCIFKALEESWLSSPWESPHKGDGLHRGSYERRTSHRLFSSVTSQQWCLFTKMIKQQVCASNWTLIWKQSWQSPSSWLTCSGQIDSSFCCGVHEMWFPLCRDQCSRGGPTSCPLGCFCAVAAHIPEAKRGLVTISLRGLPPADRFWGWRGKWEDRNCCLKFGQKLRSKYFYLQWANVILEEKIMPFCSR